MGPRYNWDVMVGTQVWILDAVVSWTGTVKLTWMENCDFVGPLYLWKGAQPNWGFVLAPAGLSLFSLL